MPKELNLPKRLLTLLRHARAWLDFHYKALFPRRIKGSLALLHNSSNYYHYLVESIAAIAQIQKSGIEPDYYLIAQDTPFQKQMIDLLGIPKHKILPPKSHALLHADTLLVPTLIANVEIAEYRDRILWARTLALPTFVRDFYDELLTSLKSQSLLTAAPAKRKIFLTRPSHSNRNITNLKEVEEIFASFGYEIILPDSLSLLEQISLAHNAKILASMHGAGLANALFMSRDSIVFEIFPKFYHDPSAMLCALLRGCHYTYMVADTPYPSPHPQQESACVDRESLTLALSRLEGLKTESYQWMPYLYKHHPSSIS